MHNFQELFAPTVLSHDLVKHSLLVATERFTQWGNIECIDCAVELSKPRSDNGGSASCRSFSFTTWASTFDGIKDGFHRFGRSNAHDVGCSRQLQWQPAVFRLEPTSTFLLDVFLA